MTGSREVQMLPRLVDHLPRSVVRLARHAREKSWLVRSCTDWFADQLRSQDGTIRAGIAAGLRFNTGRSNAKWFEGTAEPDVGQALADLLRPRMTFYDIGAKFGIFSVLAARIVGPAGAVVSFEPMPENFRLLVYNARLNNFLNIRCLPTALADHDGEGLFLVAADPSQGALATNQCRPDEFVREVRVEVRRLDSLMADRQVPPPDIVKMDIEGGEVAALAGAGKLLTTARPILVVELHETAEAVARVLARQNYKACLFGSRVPVGLLTGNAHIVAVPSELDNCAGLLERFRDPNFPRCDRCRSIPGA
jgi:FkbM family methyltransferase